ncbi:hypothetical protein ABK040_007774 [Willaertia magna]
MQQQQILLLLRKLIQIHIPKQKHQTEDEYEQYINRLLRFLTTLLSSRITPSLIQTQDQILLGETIKKRLLKENKSDQLFKFSQLFHKLNSKQMLTNKFNLIYVLNSLGISNQLERGLINNNLSINNATFNFQDNLFKLQNTIKEENQIKRDLLITSPQQNYQPQSNTFSTQNNNTLINNTEIINNHRQQYKQFENTNFEISESILIRDVIYVFQGINGNNIKFDIGLDRFMLDVKVGVPKSTRLLICKLCEMGWLYKKIKQFIDNHNLTSNNNTNGLVSQSFCSAIDKELVEYYKSISTLETQIESQEQTQNPITLRRLAVWAIEPTEVLKFIAILTDACKSKRGGLIASVVYQYTKHGDPLVKNLVSKILEQVCVPIFKMIKDWVTNGELEDPYNEFFVKSNSDVNIDKLWSRKYTFEKEMVPPFIDNDLASKILITGKSINFIRQCCKDTEWAMDIHTTVSLTEGLDYYNISKLEDIVDKVAKVANRRVIELIFDQYKFMQHCFAIKQYLLLGQGDFIQHLLELLHSELNKPTHSIYKHNLLGILESAIRGSNAQYDDQDVINRLDVRLLQPKDNSSDNGWDIFCLDYKITVPLDTIFSKEVMNVYLRIFKFLWNIKRVELMLNETWKKVVNIIRVITALGKKKSNNALITKLLQSLHYSAMIRHEMSRFIASMQFFLMFEVLETSWEKFCNDVKKLRENDGDLDQIISAHYLYLSRIVDLTFLSKSQQNTRVQLEQILLSMIKFMNTQDVLCLISNNAIQKLDDYMEEEDGMDEESVLSEEDQEQLNNLQQCHFQLQQTKNSFEVLSKSINLTTVLDE